MNSVKQKLNSNNKQMFFPNKPTLKNIYSFKNVISLRYISSFPDL